MKLPKTHSLRRMKTKLPGGGLSIHYKERRPKRARDPVTKELLPGVPSLNPYRIRKLPKSQRRPNRPYGGVLSSSEMRKLIVKRKEIHGIPLKKYPLEVGRLVVKIAGRDAGKIGVIVERGDKNTVLIDGQVRRKNCSISHIETLDGIIKIKPKATTEIIRKELEELKIPIVTMKPKQKKQKPEKTRKTPKKEETPEEKQKREKGEKRKVVKKQPEKKKPKKAKTKHE